MTDAEKIKLLRDALEKCSELFSEIRGDWTDPRTECRKGWDIIDEALKNTLSEPDLHDSDCATHREPAYPNGPCDCSRAKLGE